MTSPSANDFLRPSDRVVRMESAARLVCRNHLTVRKPDPHTELMLPNADLTSRVRLTEFVWIWRWRGPSSNRPLPASNGLPPSRGTRPAERRGTGSPRLLRNSRRKIPALLALGLYQHYHSTWRGTGMSHTELHDFAKSTGCACLRSAGPDAQSFGRVERGRCFGVPQRCLNIFVALVRQAASGSRLLCLLRPTGAHRRLPVESPNT